MQLVTRCAKLSIDVFFVGNVTLPLEGEDRCSTREKHRLFYRDFGGLIICVFPVSLHEKIEGDKLTSVLHTNLHLKNTDVRDRIRAYRKDNGIQRPKEIIFVELDMISPKAVIECTIEMERPAGRR